MSHPVPAPRPDLSSRLLAAVAERDPHQTRHLGQRWVHRRGLEALDRFLLTALAPTQGPEAALWLRAQLGLEPAPSAAGANPAGLDIDAVPIDERELAALERELAALPELLAETPSSLGTESRSLEAGAGPAVFRRMTALLRQCLEATTAEAEAGPVPLQARPQPPLAACPAPAPPSLALLRTWLPHGEQDGRDLPRAC